MDQAAIDRGDFLKEDLPADEEVAETTAAPAAEAEAPETAAPETEAEAPAVEEEEPPRDEKGRFIPKTRFDEAVGKEREAREAAERRAAELESRLLARQQTETQTQQLGEIETKISALETKYQELLIDGQTKEAAEVMREMRMAERQIARIEAQNDAKQTTTQILEAERFDLSVAKLEADYPVLNPESETYDAELVELILDRQARLVQTGMPPSKAIAEATKKIMDRFNSTLQDQPKTDGLAAAKLPDRKAEQVAKNLQVKQQQPPNMKDVGLDSDKMGEKATPNIAQMSLEEFNALPASTKARLRGDML